VIAVRVSPPLHQEIAAVAKAAQSTMSAEMDRLLRAALEIRKRLPGSAAAQAIEMATLGFILAGNRRAKEKGITGAWENDLECRRAAILAACTPLITEFLSDDPQEQILTVESLKGRIWTAIANRPRRSEGDAP
jgi:hypothetical protein